MWKGALTVYTGKVGEITKVGEFTMIFSELPNMSLPNEALIDQNQKMVQYSIYFLEQEIKSVFFFKKKFGIS